MYKIKNINITNFRAMRKQSISIPDEAKIILLLGNNGLGKTTFFDAIEWGFTGTIRRYEPKSREKNSEVFLQNKYSNKPGIVELVLQNNNGGHRNQVTINRKTEIRYGNDYNEGDLSISGADVNSVSQILMKQTDRKNFSFNNSFNFTHLLSQEIIGDFIRNYKEKDRYSILSGLIGIRGFARYSKYFKELKKQCDKRIEEMNNKKAVYEKERDILKNQLNKENKEDKISIQKSLLKLLNKENIIKIDDIDFDTKEEMNKLKDKIIEKKENMESELKNLKKDQERVKKLQKGQKEYKTAIKKKIEYDKKLSNLKKLVKAFEDLEKINYINKHYNAEQTVVDLKGKIKEVEANIFLKKELIEAKESRIGLINKIKLIIEKNDEDKEFTKMISVLKDIETHKENNAKELDQLEKKINEIEGLESRLIVTARDFLVEKKELKKCPVCKSEINIDTVIRELESKMSEENNEIMAADYKRVAKLKKNIDLINKQEERLKKDLKAKYDKYSDQIIKDYNSQKENLKKLKEDLLQAEKVNKYLASFNISRENSNFKGQLEKLYGKNTEIISECEHNNIDIVKEELEKINKTIDEQKNVINNYQIDLENIGVKEIEDLTKKYKSIDQKINIYKNNIDNAGKIIKMIKKYIIQIELSIESHKLKSIKEEITSINNIIKSLSEKSQMLNELESNVPDIVNEITSDILKPYKKLANIIYKKINPQPIFTQIDWERNSSYNNGTLVMKMLSDFDYEANPSYIYSTAQVNTLVISLFLSFVLNNDWSKLDAVFMDDPVQNMDDINIFSFIDVIRSICLNLEHPGQIFISTHDHKLFKFLMKKLRIFKVFVMEYKSYGIDGVKIDNYMR